HDADGKLVTAFHVGGFNSGNLGIALLGNLMAERCLPGCGSRCLSGGRGRSSKRSSPWRARAW
ncbi:hypothetical protein ACWD4T_11560, partial [Streptomyces umbrinus]